MSIQVRGLNADRHHHLGLRRQRDHRFFNGHITVPLWGPEVAQACRCLPIGFLRERGQLQLVAITGLRQRENLFVDAAGRWLADYVPAHVRAHPFRFARRQEDGTTPVLALVENDRDVVGADGISVGNREALFTEHGEPGPPTQWAMRLFRELLRQDRAGEILERCDRLGLVIPWEIQTEEPRSGRVIHVDGLHRIDESRLNALADGDFLTLRRGGGLALIYAHLISVPLLANLKQRLRSRPAQQAATTSEGLDRVVAGDDEELFEFY